MKAMILAAGRGQRMRPLTDTTPKPLLKVGEYSLIEKHLFALSRAGFADIVINIAHHADKIMRQLGTGERYNVNITYSYEENGPFGTGGGVLQALPILGEQPFLLISGDIFTDFDFKLLTKKIDSQAHLVMVENPHYHPEGDYAVLADGVLSLGQPKLTYGNIAVLKPALFQNLQSETLQSEKFSLATILTKAVSRGLVTGECYKGTWFNVGTPEELQEVKERACS